MHEQAVALDRVFFFRGVLLEQSASKITHFSLMDLGIERLK